MWTTVQKIAMKIYGWKVKTLIHVHPSFKIPLPWNIMHQLCNSFSFTVNSWVIHGNFESTLIREDPNHQNSEFCDTQWVEAGHTECISSKYILLTIVERAFEWLSKMYMRHTEVVVNQHPLAFITSQQFLHKFFLSSTDFHNWNRV